MTNRPIGKWILWSTLGLVVFVVFSFGFLAASKSFNRYQKRADAENNVKVSEIQTTYSFV